MKKIITTIVALFFLMVPTAAFAQETAMTTNCVDFSNTMEIQQQNENIRFMNQVDEKNTSLSDVIDQSNSDGNISSKDVTPYRTTYGAKKTVTKTVVPFNQPKNGTKFPTGGGFYYTLEGSGSISISVAFAGKYGTISVSIPVGSVGSGGYYAKAPTKTKYYKLEVITKYDVTPYVIEKKQMTASGTYTWVKWYTGYTKDFVSQVANVKSV